MRSHFWYMNIPFMKKRQALSCRAQALFHQFLRQSKDLRSYLFPLLSDHKIMTMAMGITVKVYAAIAIAVIMWWVKLLFQYNIKNTITESARFITRNIHPQARYFESSSRIRLFDRVFFLVYCNSCPVADLLASSGQSIIHGGFTRVRVTCQGYSHWISFYFFILRQDSLTAADIDYTLTSIG